MLSHAKSMYPISNALAAAGHEVVFLEFQYERNGSFRQEVRNNVTTTFVVPTSMALLNQEDIGQLWARDTSQPWLFFEPWKRASIHCKEVLRNDFLRQKFLQVSRMHWDLIVVDALFCPCGMIIAKENNAPAVTFDTSKTWIGSHEAKGTMWSRSLYPLYRVAVSRKPSSSFEERTINFWTLILFDLTMKITYRLMPFWIGFSGADHLERFYARSLFSMSMLPTYLDSETPMALDVFCSKLNCPPAAALSAEYESFVNNPDSMGTIVMALGHYISWDKVPIEAFDSFFLAFSKLKRYRFVLQCNVNLINKFTVPEHVMVRDWLPQAALLNHPRTVLFISHVGLKSLIDALCARVSIVTLPIFAEQHVNAMIVNARGIGVDLDRHSLSTEKVESAVVRVVTNGSFKRNVDRLSSMLQDNLLQGHNEQFFHFQFFMRHHRQMNFIRQRSTRLGTLVLYLVDAMTLSFIMFFGLLKFFY